MRDFNEETITKKGIVTQDVYIREKPNNTSNIIGFLVKGDTIEILDEENGYYKFSKGYCNMKYVRN